VDGYTAVMTLEAQMTTAQARKVQQLGLKKRSKRKTPVRRNGTPAAAVEELE
jgi:hypothetical protein